MALWSWSQCLICQRWPTATLCAACHDKHAAWVPRCPSCALPLTESTQDGGHAGCLAGVLWRQATARVDYTAPFDVWVKRLKFAADVVLTRPMAELMRECPVAQAALRDADWVMPMPVSKERLRDRGYNQAACLARQWCGRDARLRVDWLIKHRHTPSQAQASREQRLGQLQGSMALHIAAMGPIRGSRVLLVDDVMTTGATLDTAAQCLLQAGASRVDVAVFARTPSALH
ncbi:MAG: phosphoribosyltransferase family protein [Alphaproteobacteria bacterium]|nr:phosphoribosyltransferase family protein [Alphaproteobacteria bacterium]